MLTLVSKPGCGLCVEMRAVLLALLPASIRLEEIDVRDHADLERRYVFEIPCCSTTDASWRAIASPRPKPAP